MTIVWSPGFFAQVAASVVTLVRQADTVTTRVEALVGFHTVLHQTLTVFVPNVSWDGLDVPQQYDGGLAFSVWFGPRSGVYRIFWIATCDALGQGVLRGAVPLEVETVAEAVGRPRRHGTDDQADDDEEHEGQDEDGSRLVAGARRRRREQQRLCAPPRVRVQFPSMSPPFRWTSVIGA